MAELEVNIQQGILLFISAFGLRREKHPQTLLSFSRMNAYIQKLKDHQMFIYFAVGHPLRDENGEIIMIRNSKGELEAKKGKLSLNNFHYLYNTVVKKDMAAARGKGSSGLELFTAGVNTINWIQSEILTHPKMKERATNKAGSADADVSIYHYIGPLLSQEDDLDKILGKRYGSVNKPEILKNTYAGYNNQLIIRANRLNTGSQTEKDERAKELSQMVGGFLYFNNVVRGRIKDKEHYMRLSDSQLDDKPYADKVRTVREFVKETEEFMQHFAMGIADLANDNNLRALAQQILFTSPTSRIANEDMELEFRDKLKKAIIDLNKTKPAELAALAAKTSTLMTGMSGAAFSKDEMEKKSEAAAAAA
jgi:hypothetical protein